MKITALAPIATLLLGATLLPSRTGAQDVQDYSVGKHATLSQTSTAAPTIDSFGFDVQVRPQNGGSLSSAQLTLPAGSTNPSPQALGSGGNGSLVFGGGSITQGGLDAQFNNGTYGFSITGGSGSYSANLALTGNAYPAPPPAITNTNWSGGELVIDPAQDFTFTWNLFGNFTAGDSVGLFDDSGVFNFNFDTNTTSQFIAAGTLASNTSYTFHLTFSHLVDTNTSSIPGANGRANYFANTSFTVRTVSGPPVITSPLVATGTVGLPFTYQFTASGATSLDVPGSIAPGLVFSTSLGAIAGKPTTAGVFQVGLRATNSAGTTPGALTITVQSAPSGLVIVSSIAATGRTGRPFSFQLQTIGGSSATRFAVDGLPPLGLNLDSSTGYISGTPTSNGSFGLAVSAIDGTATTNATLQLTFTSDPTVPIITSERTATLTPGQPFTYLMTADANGTFGYIGSDGIVHQAPSPSCAGLPAGLCFDGINKISGTFNPPFGSDRKSPTRPDQTGGIITNVQLFAANPPNGSIIPLFPLRAVTGAQNIATRLAVGTGENVLIGGFIIAESVAGSGGPKKVVIRAVGPSLTQFGVPNALQDPTLELRDGAALLLGSNDNWRDSPGQANQIIETDLQPGDDREAAILAYLNPGPYTAVVRGKNDSTGNALVEVYDLGTVLVTQTSNSKLANIATRGTVLGGDSVMIGGFIIKETATRMVVRAIGPSLSNFGISGALQDPTLELKNSNGVTLISNNDWQQGQPVEIQQAGLAPTDPRESALITTLPAGQFTAIVSGTAGTTGVAVVEGYALSNP